MNAEEVAAMRNAEERLADGHEFNLAQERVLGNIGESMSRPKINTSAMTPSILSYNYRCPNGA